MVKIELPMIFIKDINQTKTNLHSINLKTYSHSINPLPMHIKPDFFPYGFYSPKTFLLPEYFPPCHSARSRKAKSQNPSSKKLPSFSGRGLTVPDGGWGPVKYIFPHLLINFPQSLDAGVWANFCTLKIDPHRRVETITNFVGSFFTKMSHENNIHQSII